MVGGEQGWREGWCTQGPFIDQVDGPSGRNPRMGHSVDRGTRRLAWGIMDGTNSISDIRIWTSAIFKSSQNAKRRTAMGRQRRIRAHNPNLVEHDVSTNREAVMIKGTSIHDIAG